MADNTTELEVLDEIVDVLGGQSGQHETVVPTLQQIRDLLGGGGGGGGYNPALSVGRADALTGADTTAQWATRESTGSGAATVRSVQGATEVQDGELVPVQIAGIQSVGFNLLPSDLTERLESSPSYVKTICSRTIQPDLFVKYMKLFSELSSLGATLFWHAKPSTTSTATGYLPVGSLQLQGVGGTAIKTIIRDSTFTLSDIQLSDVNALVLVSAYPSTDVTFSEFCINVSDPARNGEYEPYRIVDSVEWPTQTLRAAGSVADELTADELVTRVGERAYQSGDESDATVRTDGTTTYYPLATPTTTPITPTLPMTYRVEQGGSESIIVPDGEITAAPVLTVAEGESAADVVMDALACIAAPDGPVATSSHAVNTYLTMQGKLYKVTSAIAVGETIKSGTNVSETTVMAELIARTA